MDKKRARTGRKCRMHMVFTSYNYGIRSSTLLTAYAYSNFKIAFHAVIMKYIYLIIITLLTLVSYHLSLPNELVAMRHVICFTVVVAVSISPGPICWLEKEVTNSGNLVAWEGSRNLQEAACTLVPKDVILEMLQRLFGIYSAQAIKSKLRRTALPNFNFFTHTSRKLRLSTTSSLLKHDSSLSFHSSFLPHRTAAPEVRRLLVTAPRCNSRVAECKEKDNHLTIKFSDEIIAKL